jgi:hypothetical protein
MMKKTLMVLSFALCATVVFAQTNKATVTSTKANAVAVSKAQPVEVKSANYNGSIFTKEDEEYFHCDFSATNQGYSVGTVDGVLQVNGETVPQHTQTAYHSRWQRIDSTHAVLSTDYYPATAGSTGTPGIFRYLRPGTYADPANDCETGDNGFMMMTMQDQIQQWGGTGATGNFDSYIAFPSFSTVGATMVRTYFFQYYRCFNSDKCWIDYSTDNSTWYAVEINVRGVDVATNDSRLGWVSTMLPTSLANNSNVYIRVRWSCDDNGGGAYGYVWYLDDFYVIDVPMNSAHFDANDYFEGFYQMMPKDLQVPVVWNNVFYNNGQTAHTNVVGGIYTYGHDASGNLTPATPVALKNRSFILSGEKKSLIIDPLGWFDSAAVGRPSSSWSSVNGLGYWETGYNNRTGAYGCLPTDEVGVRHFYSDIQTSLRPNHIGINDSTTFDTLRYEVNWGAFNDTVNCGVWSRDNGIVGDSSYWVLGLNDGYWSESLEDVGWGRAGYGVFVSYVTGDTVPEGWKILGMEMVAATRPDMQEPGARLDAYVLLDARDSAGIPYFYYLNTGASTYVTSSDDYINTQALQGRFYTYDNPEMKTIRITFPNQPALEAFSSYRVGYRLNEDAQFLLAASSSSYLNNGEYISYGDVEGMESYGHRLPVANSASILINDDGYTFYLGQHDYYPMIRLLVGPGYYVPKVPVTFTCDDVNLGWFQNGADEVLCGEEDSIAVGASYSVIIMPVDESYEIENVWIDDQVVSLGSHPETGYQYDTVHASSGVIYGELTLDNVQAAKNLRCKFKARTIGFDPVANKVSMKLQPNPATSNVNITMKGVTGMVNMSLIDMSGRVVTTRQFNAENGTNVNVSNLAKGAYFVRITNDNFTKIEKLIVR